MAFEHEGPRRTGT